MNEGFGKGFYRKGKGDASFLLTVEVFLLTVRFYLRCENRKQKGTKPDFRTGGNRKHFLSQKGNLIRIKTGLAYLIRIQTRTPLSWYPPYDYSNFLTVLRLFGLVSNSFLPLLGLYSLRCKIPWPIFSRKPHALTSINRRKSTINPEITSINVC